MIRLGKYTVIARPRFDNPFWAQYVVYIGEQLIGKSFSMPDLDCCAWLERQEGGRVVYAGASAKLRGHTIRGLDKARLISRQRRSLKET